MPAGASISSRVTPAVRNWAGHSFDYGYGWWITSDGGRDVIAASGAMGQWILVIPSARLVVVVTSDDDSRFTARVEFLSSHVLPSVTRLQQMMERRGLELRCIKLGAHVLFSSAGGST